MNNNGLQLDLVHMGGRIGCLHVFGGGRAGGRALRSGGPGGRGGRGPGGSTGLGEFVVNWPLRYFLFRSHFRCETWNVICRHPPPSQLSAVA